MLTASKEAIDDYLTVGPFNEPYREICAQRLNGHCPYRRLAEPECNNCREFAHRDHDEGIHDYFRDKGYTLDERGTKSDRLVYRSLYSRGREKVIILHQGSGKPNERGIVKVVCQK